MVLTAILIGRAKRQCSPEYMCWQINYTLFIRWIELSSLRTTGAWICKDWMGIEFGQWQIFWTQYIYLISQERGPYLQNIGPRSWQARSVEKTPRIDILPVRSRARASLVNKRFVTRLEKNATITDWRTEGKESWKKKKGIFYAKASSFRNVSHKTARKPPRVIVRDNSEYWTGNGAIW